MEVVFEVSDKGKLAKVLRSFLHAENEKKSKIVTWGPPTTRKMYILRPF